MTNSRKLVFEATIVMHGEENMWELSHLEMQSNLADAVLDGIQEWCKPSSAEAVVLIESDESHDLLGDLSDEDDQEEWDEEE